MPLPGFNAQGDLPEGVHRASLSEVVARFGGGGPERQRATANLVRIHQLAVANGKLQRFIIFGSYITSKPDPNDVDVILGMCDDFQEEACDARTVLLFKHGRAATEFGASIFWARPSMLVGLSMDEFIAHWQTKRDLGRRGIVEVIR